MDSTLILFTKREYADSYRTGNLYLSSLSEFWDFMKGTIPYRVSATPEQLEEIDSDIHKMRQDFSEGVIAQIPRNSIPVLSNDFKESLRIIHDIRFRLNAYKYCNLLCFFRIDAKDGIRSDLDEDNISLLLKDIGKNISANEIRRMMPAEAFSLVNSVIEPNPLLVFLVLAQIPNTIRKRGQISDFYFTHIFTP